MKSGYHKNDENVGKEKTRDRNQEIREERCGAVVYPAPEDGRTYSHGKGKGPCQDRAHDEKGQTVEKSLPYLFKDRLIILPGDGSSREQVTIKVDILDVKGFVQVELLSKPLHHLRCELGIQGICLTRFTGSKVNDQKRYDRNKEKGYDLLYDTTCYEG